MRKKNILILFLVSFTIFSCEDYLEEDNRSNETVEFYKTAEGFELLVSANYGILREIYGQEPFIFASGTDMYAEGREAEPPGLSSYTQLNSNSEGISDLYRRCYKAIQIANMGVYFSEQTEETPQLNQQLGSIKFLRANAYFLLVQTYGGVGLVTEYIEERKLEFDRNSAEEVYAFIISELEEALTLVDDTAYSGQVTKRAVRNLLAKVYLTRGYEDFGNDADFSQAAQYADEAINGEALSLSFSELWNPDYTIKQGVIFSVQYDEESVSTDPFELGHQQGSYFGPYQGGSEISGEAPYRTYKLCPTQYAVDLFSEEDSRWNVTFMTEVYNPYYEFFETEDYSGLKVDHYYEAKWNNTDTFKQNYLANHPDVTYHDYGSYVPSVNPNNDYQTIPVKKFDDPEAPFGINTNRRDIILARLGETYLTAAEAYLQAGDAPTGLERLNAVRERAGVPDATLAEFNIDYILDERGRELLGEYYRWFDLKRTGTLVERAAAYNYRVETTNFNGANGELKILRPIPQSALDLNQNKTFPQNPAYQ